MINFKLESTINNKSYPSLGGGSDVPFSRNLRGNIISTKKPPLGAKSHTEDCNSAKENKKNLHLKTQLKSFKACQLSPGICSESDIMAIVNHCDSNSSAY